MQAEADQLAGHDVGPQTARRPGKARVGARLSRNFHPKGVRGAGSSKPGSPPPHGLPALESEAAGRGLRGLGLDPAPSRRRPHAPGRQGSLLPLRNQVRENGLWFPAGASVPPGKGSAKVCKPSAGDAWEPSLIPSVAPRLPKLLTN